MPEPKSILRKLTIHWIITSERSRLFFFFVPQTQLNRGNLHYESGIISHFRKWEFWVQEKLKKLIDDILESSAARCLQPWFCFLRVWTLCCLSNTQIHITLSQTSSNSLHIIFILYWQDFFLVDREKHFKILLSPLVWYAIRSGCQ